MVVVSLDKIVKNILLKRGYPMHYYLQFLVYSKDGLREMAMDEPIITTRYKVCAVNTNNAIVIPNDYLDYTKISVRIGQFIKPLIEDNTLDLVPNYDSNFDIQPYNQGVQSQDNSSQLAPIYSGYSAPYWWMVNYNTFGENLGRQFGGVAGQTDTFRVNKARNEIKINEDFWCTEILLEYIGNGMDADSATHIDPYAEFAIEAFAMWQHKSHNRTYSASEAELARQEYVNQRQIMRARISDITIDRLKRIVQHNSVAVKY